MIINKQHKGYKTKQVYIYIYIYIYMIFEEKKTKAIDGINQEIKADLKREYKIIGSFLKTKGLKLFMFNGIDVVEVKTIVSNKANIINTGKRYMAVYHEN